MSSSYACPEHAYISSSRWPIQDFSDCSCSWGFGHCRAADGTDSCIRCPSGAVLSGGNCTLDAMLCPGSAVPPSPSVDCVLSDWSDWSACSAECGGGKQTRTRTITTAAANGGEACGALTEEQACNTQDCTCVANPTSRGDKLPGSILTPTEKYGEVCDKSEPNWRCPEGATPNCNPEDGNWRCPDNVPARHLTKTNRIDNESDYNADQWQCVADADYIFTADRSWDTRQRWMDKNDFRTADDRSWPSNQTLGIDDTKEAMVQWYTDKVCSHRNNCRCEVGTVLDGAGPRLGGIFASHDDGGWFGSNQATPPKPDSSWFTTDNDYSRFFGTPDTVLCKLHKKSA